MAEIIAFTDGASRGNPGPGGWGAVVVSGKKITELGGFEKNTTNNRMELMAAIKALEFVTKPKITIYTDSSYVKRGVTQWVSLWKETGWKTKAKEEVQNKDLWERISDLVANKKVDWKLVSGHVGIAGNERADKISTDFALGKNPTLFSGSLSKYSLDILNINYDESAQEKKSSSRSRSRAKAYSYVSLVNGEVKVHKTWEECEKRVKGVRGALYKKAVTPEEEKEIISEYKQKSLL